MNLKPILPALALVLACSSAHAMSVQDEAAQVALAAQESSRPAEVMAQARLILGTPILSRPPADTPTPVPTPTATAAPNPCLAVVGMTQEHFTGFALVYGQPAATSTQVRAYVGNRLVGCGSVPTVGQWQTNATANQGDVVRFTLDGLPAIVVPRPTPGWDLNVCTDLTFQGSTPSTVCIADAHV